LLLQRLRKVRRPLPQFVEQPRVLDCDDGLGCEVRHQLNLPISKGTHLLPGQVECTDQFVIFQHWDHYMCPDPAKFDGSNHPFITSFKVVLVLRKVCDVDGFSVCCRLT
jgi:hypothetical protein